MMIGSQLVEHSVEGQGIPKGFETVFNGRSIFGDKIHKMTSHAPFIDIGDFRF